MMRIQLKTHQEPYIHHTLQKSTTTTLHQINITHLHYANKQILSQYEQQQQQKQKFTFVLVVCTKPFINIVCCSTVFAT